MCIGGDRAEVLRFLHDLPVRKVGGRAERLINFVVVYAMGVGVSGGRAVSSGDGAIYWYLVGVAEIELVVWFVFQQNVEGLLVTLVC